ncbi:hypothetical protein FRB93_007677 [Tulasnella sp. JGI-2019a]|nr:hypothetical protein FRB93_007677 [Tulasnella sp. JGI-2019a]
MLHLLHTPKFPSPLIVMRALDIPEILSQVLDLVGDGDKVASALVCRTWNSVALDAIWRDVNDLVQLLRLIGDVKAVNGFNTIIHCGTDLELEFSQSLEGTDWFDSYAARVISLDWDSQGLSFSPTVFERIHAARPGSSPLLPNLLTIKCQAYYDVDADHVLHFLSRSVTSLHIQYKTLCTAPRVAASMSSLATFAPEVSKLTVECLFRVDMVDEALSSWIESLKKLREVTLPRYFGSQPIVKALGSTGGLESVSGHAKLSRTTEHASVILGTHWSLPSSAFERLQFIDFDATLAQAVEIFSGSPLPELRGLWLNAVGPVTNPILQPCILALVAWCKDLEDLSLNLLPPMGTTDRERIRFQILDPLLRLRKLQKLQIIHDHSIYLVEENVEAMSLAWPRLIQLSFRGGNPREAPQTSFSILKSFAIKFSNIQRLAITLHIDGDVSVVDSVPPTFTSLQELHLDTSRIHGQQSVAVATLLSLICPLGVKILFGIADWQQMALRRTGWDVIAIGAMGRQWESIANGVGSYYSIHGRDGNPMVAAMYFQQWFANQPNSMYSQYPRLS